MSNVYLDYYPREKYLVNQLTFPEDVVTRWVNDFSASKFRSILPVSVKGTGKNTVLRCSITGLQSLKKYLKKKTVSRKDFLFIVNQILEGIEECASNKVDIKNVMLTVDNVYINPTNKEVKLICWPIVNNQLFFPAKDFFQKLVSFVQFSSADDVAFLSLYYQFFVGYEVFNITEFKRTINEYGKSGNAPSSNIKDNKNYSCNASYDPFSQKSNIENISFSECERTSAVLVRKESNNNSQQIALEIKHNKKLFILTNSIEKIGKNPEMNDLVLDSKYVSKEHAKLITRDDHYYIVDTDSKNGTYIDEKRIRSQVEYEIQNGNSIRFADVECILKRIEK